MPLDDIARANWGDRHINPLPDQPLIGSFQFMQLCQSLDYAGIGTGIRLGDVSEVRLRIATIDHQDVVGLSFRERILPLFVRDKIDCLAIDQDRGTAGCE